MVKINENYTKLAAGYLFPEIGRRVKAYSEKKPNSKVIRLGIGDVTQPLPQACVDAAHKALDEMTTVSGFHGYGPEQGYDFLREAIAKNDFVSRGAQVDADEIFVSDGSKCDTGNIQEIFDFNCKIAVPDPVYPVYVDTNVMAGRTGPADKSGRYQGLFYLESNKTNGFIPDLPKEKVDVIYLCFPNNPTGVVASHDVLQKWVQYALKNDAIILFDAAYEAFIMNENLPRSIYEIPDARKCAIEFRSFSKSAGFTGTRCAFTVVPKDLTGQTSNGERISLHQLWNRRHCTKFNGVSYPIQRAAEACYSDTGKKQIQDLIQYYMSNAEIILSGLKKLGYEVYGGVNAPYIWFKTPNNLGSWEFFDLLLNKAEVVGTPGAGFGSCGEGYFRLSAFGQRANVEEAVERIKSRL